MAEDADLFAAIRGQPAPKAAKPAVARMDPRDALIRTVAFEASPDGPVEERQGIASVIANRARISGKDYTDVVQEKGQFEPWSKRRKEIEAFTPDNPRYQQIAKDVEDVLGGKDTTGGATHFYAPAANAAAKDGRKAVPEWDDGTGTDIGATRFIRGKYGSGFEEPDADIAAAIRGERPKGNISFAAASPGATTSAGPEDVITQAQQDAHAKLTKAKALNLDEPKGSVRNPFFQVKEGEVPEGEGAYFVDLDGKLQRTAGGDRHVEELQAALKNGDYGKASRLATEHKDEMTEAFGSRFVSGLLLGGKNEAASIIHHPLDFLTQGGIDAPSVQTDIAQRDAVDAKRQADFPGLSAAGAVTGALTGGAAISAATGGAATYPFLARAGMAALEGGAIGGAQGFLAGDGSTSERLPGMTEGAWFKKVSSDLTKTFRYTFVLRKTGKSP